MSYAENNKKISSSTMTSGRKIKKLTKEDLTEEERQDLEEHLAPFRKEFLAQYIRTDQGIIKRDVPLPQVVVSPKVTSNPPDLSLSAYINRCVDASISAYIDKNHDMLQDAFNTSFNESIKKIGSKIASYQQYNATSNTMDR